LSSASSCATHTASEAHQAHKESSALFSFETALDFQVHPIASHTKTITKTNSVSSTMASNTKHDIPTLTNTVAAREATPVGEVPAYHASIKSRLPQSRRRSQSGTPSGRVGEPTDDYFVTPGPMKSRSHEDMRSASAASAGPATTHPTAPTHSTAPNHPTAPAPAVNLIAPTDSTPSTPSAESTESAESATAAQPVLSET